MKIYIGADHRGYKLKEALEKYLSGKKYEVIDIGGIGESTDDYPDFAQRVAEAVAADSETKGILICGSGVGVNIVANKFKGARASLIFDVKQAHDSRADEDPNILTLSADFTPVEKALEIADMWLGTQFSGLDRHVRRVSKISEVERKNFR